MITSASSAAPHLEGVLTCYIGTSYVGPAQTSAEVG
jgi:hypothetical protein